MPEAGAGPDSAVVVVDEGEARRERKSSRGEAVLRSARWPSRVW
jgi:hypothetical protein